MSVTAQRTEFMPPPQPGRKPAWAFALLAHLLLLLALSWGTQWRQSHTPVVAEAELWSSVALQAAAQAQEPEAPPPAPARPAQATPPQPVDIATARSRKARPEPRHEPKKEPERKTEDKAQQKKLEDERRRQKERQEAEREKAEARLLQAQREANLKRMSGLANASGSTPSNSTALQSSGPSASYGQRLAALFKRNISFPNPQAITGNAKAVVEVRVSASGFILSQRLLKSSGTPAWDNAVMLAVEKTERIPADEHGRYVEVFPVEFGPKD